MTQMTAAPTTLILGPNQYTMSPLDNADYDEYLNWVRAMHVKQAREAARASVIPVEESMSAEDKAKIIRLNVAEEIRMVDRALDQSASVTMMSHHTLSMMCTPMGVAKMLHIGITKNHPNVTVKEILKEILDKKVLEDALDDFDNLNRVEIRKGSTSDVKKKPPARQDGQKVKRQRHRKRQRQRRRTNV